MLTLLEVKRRYEGKYFSVRLLNLFSRIALLVVKEAIMLINNDIIIIF